MKLLNPEKPLQEIGKLGTNIGEKVAEEIRKMSAKKKHLLAPPTPEENDDFRANPSEEEQTDTELETPKGLTQKQRMLLLRTPIRKRLRPKQRRLV